MVLGKYDEVYDSLKKGAEESGNFEVYKQDQLLDRWHMKNTPRLNGIIYLLAQPKFMFWDDYLQTILDKTSEYLKGRFESVISRLRKLGPFYCN